MKLLQQLLPGEDLFGLIGRSFVFGPHDNYRAMRHALALTHYKHLPGIFMSRDFAKISTTLGKDIENLHNEHTCFNMLRSSLNADKLEYHVRQSKGVTFNSNNDAVEYPWRWCSDCVAEDIASYGIPYYHRDHQIPGVKRCYKHQRSLVSQCYNCNFEAKSIRFQPFPPINGLCPHCNNDLEGDVSLLTPVMIKVEDICVDMAYGRLQVSQQQLIDRVQHFVGIKQEDVNQDIVRKEIRAFYLQLTNFYGLDELQEYFDTSVIRKSGIYCPSLQSARLYSNLADGLPLHPVAVAMVWNFLNEQYEVPIAA